MKHLPLLLLLITLAACSGAQTTQQHDTSPLSVEERVPSWAADAVFYQIFPERFRNGDPSNDPTRETLETPIVPSESWQITPWTSDWYSRAEWEKELGDDFYDDGVFHRRYGGDLQGVIDQLDYLAELGINVIYFNPIFVARSMHKYDGNSFHHVDPHFGPDPDGDFALIAQEDPMDPDTWAWTSADLLFLDLLDGAHDRGIRVIIDGVFNHTGREFPAFADIRENQQESRFRDWYIVHEWDDPATPEDEFRYKGWWDVETLPEFAEVENDLHSGPKEYIFNSTRRWMRPVVNGNARRGIDGWRLDVANEVPMGFWVDWNELVRELNPDAYTVTELWDDAADFLREGGFSATMNYHAFAFPVKGFFVDYAITPSEFSRMISERKEDFAPAVRFAMQNLIDSHDTDRVASMIVNANKHDGFEVPDRFDYDWGSRVSPRYFEDYLVRAPNDREWQIQRLLTLFQMTYVGAPMIYYGTEAGMWGADDPDDRKPMVWPDYAYDPETHHPLGRSRTPDEVAFKQELFDFHRDVIAMRNDEEALRRGSFDVIHTNDDAGTFGFRRSSPTDSLIVVLNRGERDVTVILDAKDAESYTPIFKTALQGTMRYTGEGRALSLSIPALGGIVLKKDIQMP